MKYPMKKADFIDGWMDMEPDLPVPKIDWIREKYLDIPYGEAKKQKFDLYYPNGVEKKDLPLLIIVHGGGFTLMDKRDWHLYPGFFALREGFAVISLNYRLAPKHKYPAGLDDVRNAILFIKEHAEEYCIDTNNIFLEGTSAGGNFVGISAYEAARDGKDYNVNSVLLFCPAIDFMTYLNDADQASMHFLFRVMENCYFHFGKHRREEKIEASLTGFVSEKIVPTFIMQGTKDVGVPYKSAERFYRQLREVSGLGEKDLVFKVLDGYGHAGSDKGFFQEENLMPAIEFLKAHIV